MTNTIAHFFSEFPVIRYKKNELVIRGYEEPNGIYFVKSGYVKMTTVLESGRELTLNIFKTGSYFPMIWALSEIPNTYFFQTITPTELIRAPRNTLLEFVKKNPDVLYDLTKRLVIGMQGLLTNIEHQMSGDSYHRVIAALFLSARRFGKKNGHGSIVFTIPLTHQTIANIAGITRETTSLTIEKLKKEKLISYFGRQLVINNIEKLKKKSTIYASENTALETM